MESTANEPKRSKINYWSTSGDISQSDYLGRLTSLRDSLIGQEQVNLEQALDRLHVQDMTQRSQNNIRQKTSKIPGNKTTDLSQNTAMRNDMISTVEKFRSLRPKVRQPAIFPLQGVQILDNSQQTVTLADETGSEYKQRKDNENKNKNSKNKMDHTVQSNLKRLLHLEPSSSIPNIGRKAVNKQQHDLELKTQPLLNIRSRVHRSQGYNVGLVSPFRLSPEASSNSETDKPMFKSLPEPVLQNDLPNPSLQTYKLIPFRKKFRNTIKQHTRYNTTEDQLETQHLNSPLEFYVQPKYSELEKTVNICNDRLSYNTQDFSMGPFQCGCDLRKYSGQILLNQMGIENIGSRNISRSRDYAGFPLIVTKSKGNRVKMFTTKRSLYRPKNNKKTNGCDDGYNEKVKIVIDIPTMTCLPPSPDLELMKDKTIIKELSNQNFSRKNSIMAYSPHHNILMKESSVTKNSEFNGSQSSENNSDTNSTDSTFERLDVNNFQSFNENNTEHLFESNVEHSSESNVEYSIGKNREHSGEINGENSNGSNIEHCIESNVEHSSKINVEFSIGRNRENCDENNGDHSDESNFEHSIKSNVDYSIESNLENSLESNAEHSNESNISIEHFKKHNIKDSDKNNLKASNDNNSDDAKIITPPDRTTE